MEAIKNNLKYDFVKTYKNYCLINLRRLIPEIVNYNTIDVSIADGSILLNSSEKNNPVEDTPIENIKPVENVEESQEPAEPKQNEQSNLPEKNLLDADIKEEHEYD